MYNNDGNTATKDAFQYVCVIKKKRKKERKKEGN